MKLKAIRSISSVYQYFLVGFILGITSLVCIPISNSQGYHVVSFILLFVVSILSTFLGVGPVLLASTLGALIWNFFFIPPHHTFNIAKTEDILIFGLFFIVALVNGVLTTRLRKEERIAREREKRTNALFQLTRELSIASGIDQVIQVSNKQINNYFGFEPVFLVLDDNDNLVKKSQYSTEQILTPKEFSVANWVHENSLKAGATTQQSFEIASTIFPLPGSKLKPGVVVVRVQNELFLSQNILWDAFLTQVSNALERELLAEIAQKVRFLDESDRLFKTLFNSISHEFRIPVATIMGAADSMLNAADNPDIQLALTHEIFTASLRLNRLIENLLNMSRLESGHISVRLDWHDLNDLVNKVLSDLKDELKPFTLHVTLPDSLPLVRIDFGLIEQVLYNILLNATQYAPVSTIIRLDCGFINETLNIEIADQGSGFSDIGLPNAFNKFYRGKNVQTGGLGLGLSIAKGFVEAHKGSINVRNSSEGGAVFTIKLPSEVPGLINL